MHDRRISSDDEFKNDQHDVCMHVLAGSVMNVNLQKVDWPVGRGLGMFSGNLPENLEASGEFFVECEDRRQISAAVAIVGGAPHGNEVLSWIVVFVALLNELMRSADEFELVDVVKLCGDTGTEKPAGPSRTDSPGFDVLWIAPHEITEGAFVGNLLSAIDRADLIDGSDIG